MLRISDTYHVEVNTWHICDVVVPADTDAAAVERIALMHPLVRNLLAHRTLARVVVVPGKSVSIVAPNWSTTCRVCHRTPDQKVRSGLLTERPLPDGQVIVECRGCGQDRIVETNAPDFSCVNEVAIKLDAPDEIRRNVGVTPRPRVKGRASLLTERCEGSGC